MKPASFFVLLAMMATSLYPQQQPRPEDILSRLTFDSNLRLRGTFDDVRAVCRLSKEWLTPPMEHFKTLSPEHQKIVIQAASESFDASAYLEAIAAVLRGVAEGGIPPEVGIIALFPSPSSEIEGVLEVNHDDPRIAWVLPRLLGKYGDNPEVSDCIRRLISGAAKEAHIESFESYGLKPARVIAKVPPRGAASSSLLNASAGPKNSLEVSTVPMASTEKTSSEMSWSILALLIIAAAGLLWWMLKRRS
jgi:hypothetical protein